MTKRLPAKTYPPHPPHSPRGVPTRLTCLKRPNLPPDNKLKNIVMAGGAVGAGRWVKSQGAYFGGGWGDGFVGALPQDVTAGARYNNRNRPTARCGRGRGRGEGRKTFTGKGPDR
jgi:hypothetical protein